MFAIYADNNLLWFQGTDDLDYMIYDVKFEEEVNKSGSLQFNIPPENHLYNNLKKLKTTITLKEDGVEIWKGRILHDERNFYNVKQVYCEGQLSFLLDSVIRPYISTDSVADIFSAYLTQHNDQVGSDRQILVGDCTVTDPNDSLPRESKVYPKTLNEMTEKLINRLGGYFILRFDDGDWYLDYKLSYGHTSDQVIRFGENLLDISEYITAEDLITVLIPLGAKDQTTEERLTIKSVNNERDYIEDSTSVGLFGRITATKEWDDVTVASNLLSKGQAFLAENIETAVTLTIKAVDLHYLDVNTNRILLGDMVRVVSTPHALDTAVLCSKINHDLENPANTEFSFGTNYKSITDFVTKSVKLGV